MPAQRTTKQTTSKKREDKKEGVDTHWTFDFVISEFKKESDRAAVILIAAVIDEKLTTILKSKLIAVPTANDDFFEGANAPISTFSSKIDLAFRLGVISAKMSRDIHLIRKIRNSFAHDIYGCSFENGGVKSRVMELYNTCGMMSFYEHLIEENNPKVESGTRGVFLFFASTLIFHLTNLLTEIKPIEPIEETKDELIYRDGNKVIQDQIEKRAEKK